MRGEGGVLGNTDRIHILLEEYRALYGLVEFRMNSLDRRLPLTSVAVTAMVTGVLVAPSLAKPPLLIAVPTVLLWLTRNTVNHARSLEDLFRRIEEIEREVDHIAGEKLLAFQSSHPSRHRSVGGRTGQETVRTVLATCMLLLACCLYALTAAVKPGPAAEAAYALYLLAMGTALLRVAASSSGYTYRRLVVSA